jgi:hypothetical protein
MTEEEALENVSSILSAFSNDVNDGDGPVLYEGGEASVGELVYVATLEDGTKHEFIWEIRLYGHWKNGVDQCED